MNKTKLIQILKTFSPEEIQNFEKFISNPFFGIKNFVLNFYKEIIKNYPEFQEDDIIKEKLFRRIYKDKKYNDGLIRRMTSDLTKISEEFMMYKCFKETESFRDTCLLNELRLRKLNDIFENRSEKILSKLKDQNTDINTLLLKFYTENQRISYFLKNDEKKLLETSYSASSTLISFFLSALNNKTQLIQKRKNTLTAGEDSVIYDNFTKHFDYKGFIRSISKRESRDSYFIKVNYYFNLLSLNNNDTESYNKLRELLYNDFNYFTGISKYNYLIMMTTFCVNQITNNKTEYLNDYFYFMNIVLEEKLFLANSSIIGFPVLQQFITFSIMQKKYKEAEEFMQTYSKYFNPKYKEDCINYYHSVLMFSKGRFDKSLEYSSKIGLSQPLLKKEIKILKLKCFYEAGYIESLISDIDSFRHYITNEKSLNEISRMKAANFINYISRLLKVKEKISRKESIALLKEIESKEDISEKSWLIDKLKSLS